MQQEYLQFDFESLYKIIQLIVKSREQLEYYWEERCQKLYKS